MTKWARALATVVVVIAITRLWERERQNNRRKREYSSLDLHRWEDEGGNIPEVETVTARKMIDGEVSWDQPRRFQ